QGRNLVIAADNSIEIQDNVILSTRNYLNGATITSGNAATVASDGPSGSISLSAISPTGVVFSNFTPHITIGQGVDLLADATNGFKPGDVTVVTEASQISLNVPLLTNLGLDNQTANVDVKQDVTIHGKDVTVRATASDKNPIDAVNKFAGGSAVA